MRPESNLGNDPLGKLVFELSKLPGIGEKTATRLAYFILKQEQGYPERLAEAILGARMKTRLCSSCCAFTTNNPCTICNDPGRDHSVICLVEQSSDVFSIERSMSHSGVYHVLHGVLSPLDGIGPDELKIRELLRRVEDAAPTVREVILATNPSVEGEATSLYVAKILKPLNIKITKLAHGIPVGGQLEYLDRQTIGKALEHRVEII